MNVYGFQITGSSKQPLIEGLGLAFEKGDIQILDDSIQLAELEAYEKTVSKITGHAQYSAPENMHDDTVIALALAWNIAIRGRQFQAVVGGQRPVVQTYVPR